MRPWDLNQDITDFEKPSDEKTNTKGNFHAFSTHIHRHVYLK